MERYFQTPIVTEIITHREAAGHDPFIDELEDPEPTGCIIQFAKKLVEDYVAPVTDINEYRKRRHGA